MIITKLEWIILAVLMAIVFTSCDIMLEQRHVADPNPYEDVLDD